MFCRPEKSDGTIVFIYTVVCMQGSPWIGLVFRNAYTELVFMSRNAGVF